MQNFDALLKKIYSFLKENGTDMCIRNRKSKTRDEEIIIFAIFVDPGLLKRAKIKRWFRKTFKAVKSSLEEEFGRLPSLEFSYLDCGNETKNFEVAIKIKRSSYEPSLNFRTYTAPRKHIIKQSTYWDFNPLEFYSIGEEGDEEAQA
jgi:hypothetical protein